MAKQNSSTTNGANPGKQLHARVIEVVERAQLIDLRAFEERMNPARLTSLRTLVSGCLTTCCVVAEDLLKLVEDGNPVDPTANNPTTAARFARDFALKLDQLVEQKTSQLRDIAFIVRFELRSRLRRLLETPVTTEDWSTLEACDAGLRNVIKAGSTLERALCDYLGINHELNFETELQKSLNIRRDYARLRRVVADLSKNIECDVEQRLRRGGTQIAMIIGRDHYRDLRVNDRFQIRRFQTNILSWLRGDSHFDRQKAEKIWQDFATFAELLSLINNREELVTHDRNLLLRLKSLLSTPPKKLRLPPNWSAAFVSLRGLDDHVETLFKARKNEYLELWEPTVAKLLVR